MARRPQRIASPRDLVLSALFLVIWLVPMTWVGVFNRAVPAVPLYANYMYRVACLFTLRAITWSNFYYEVRLEGSNEWTEVRESGFSDLTVFGYRTRVDRMLRDSMRSFNGPQLRDSLSEFFRRRYAELHPDDPEVVAVRFVRVTYAVGGEIADPPGRWTRPPCTPSRMSKSV